MTEQLIATPKEFISPDPKEHFEVLTPMEFLKDLGAEFRSPRPGFENPIERRLWIQSISVDLTGHATGIIGNLLDTATRTGMDTRVNVDYFTFLTSNGRFDRFAKLSFEEQEHKKESIQRLANLSQNGATITMLNEPNPLEKIIPPLGRNHIKMVILDSVAWIGGVNIAEGSFTNTDIMIKITNAEMVDALTRQFYQVNASRPKDDYSVTFESDPDTEIIVDSGKRFQSAILKRAHHLAKNAKESIFTMSYFTPGGIWADDLLDAAKRNLMVGVVTSQGSKLHGYSRMLDRTNRLYLKVQSLLGRSFPIVDYPRISHGKITIFDQRTVMVGSHNLSHYGVAMGTEELMLVSQNPTLCENINAFLAKTWAKSTPRLVV